MAGYNTFGEIQPTNAHVHVGNKPIQFAYLRLEQEFGKHHQFTIKADFNALGQQFMQSPLEHLNLIGKTVDIEIKQGNDGKNAYLFRGLVQNVTLEGQEGKHGYLVLNGKSPTILLERGKRYDIFTNLTLQQTVDQVCDEIMNQKQRLPLVNSPIYTGQVEFLMQYNESDWDFLRRLSSISNENLYWTGRDLVFGTHREFPTMEATYDKEIISFQFGNRYLPNNFTRYQYLAEQDDTITQDAPAQIKDANNYVKSAHERAKEIVESRPVNTPSSLPIADVGALNELVEREKISKASETVYVKGTAKTAHARIGRLLTIKMPDTMAGATNLGTYRITKVVHTFEQNDRYHCEFEGIPGDLKAYPIPEVNTPSASSIRTTVISNADPMGIGRVRVDFPFASDRVSDVWLRVMTPNAGSSNEVAKNRGMVFIPEKNDQVMVGFEFGDPNRPYVMGSMFHGKNSEGGSSNNAIKSIITRSGIKIVFNDDEKSLHIEDPSGNTWDMDGKGNINVNAPKNMTIDVGENMEINVGADVITTIGGNKQTDISGNKTSNVSGDTERTTTNLKEIIESNSDINVGEKLTQITGETDFFAESGDMVIKSAGKALVQGAEDARISKG